MNQNKSLQYITLYAIINYVTNFVLFTGGATMFDWLFRLFSMGKSRKFTGKTTNEFKDYARSSYHIDQKRGLVWYSQETLLCRYIVKTRKSPYKGDRNLKKAMALLKKNRIYLDWS